MKKLIAILFIILSVSAIHATDFSGTIANVSSLSDGQGNGIIFQFKGYSADWYVVRSTHPQYKEMMAMLLTAMTNSSNVLVSFNSTSDKTVWFIRVFGS